MTRKKTLRMRERSKVAKTGFQIFEIFKRINEWKTEKF